MEREGVDACRGFAIFEPPQRIERHAGVRLDAHVRRAYSWWCQRRHASVSESALQPQRLCRGGVADVPRTAEVLKALSWRMFRSALNATTGWQHPASSSPAPVRQV